MTSAISTTWRPNVATNCWLHESGPERLWDIITKVRIAFTPSRSWKVRRERAFSSSETPLNAPLATGRASAGDLVHCLLGSEGHTVFSSGLTPKSSSMQCGSQNSTAATRQQLHNV